jgi:sporulation protein YlmC with PRC-barrel domain
MRIKTTVLICGSVLGGLLFLNYAGAQSDPSAAPIVGKTTLGVTVAQADLIATGWRASKVLHADVRNDKGDRIGKIDDIVVDTDGTLSVAIIDVGGFLGLGGHRVAIPVSQLVFSQTRPQILLPGATKDALKALPEFKYSG